MNKLLWIDPPEGWKYGFPKKYNSLEHPDVIEWILEEGYPKIKMEGYGNFFYYQAWEVEDETSNNS